jgi:hypothetical protein
VSDDDFILKARAAWHDSFKISKLKDASAVASSEKAIGPADTWKLAINHPDHVELASRAFWDACRVDLGRAVQSMQEAWRDPMEEFEKVREAIRKGMTLALNEVSYAYHHQSTRTMTFSNEPERADVSLNQTLKETP